MQSKSIGIIAHVHYVIVSQYIHYLVNKLLCRPHTNAPMLPGRFCVAITIFIATNQLWPIVLDLIGKFREIFGTPFQPLALPISIINKFCTYSMCCIMITFIVSPVLKNIWMKIDLLIYWKNYYFDWD